MSIGTVSFAMKELNPIVFYRIMGAFLLVDAWNFALRFVTELSFMDYELSC